MATKMHSFGVKLQHDDDGVGSYTDLADVISIKPPQPEVDDSETTHLESPNAWREFIPGFIEAGELEAMVYFHKTAYALLHTTMMAARAVKFWRIQFPLLSGETTGSKLDMQGFIKQVGPEEIEDEAIKVALTIKITGAVTFTAGA